MTEAQLLAREAAHAHAAAARTAKEIGKELRNCASPGAWMDKHPIATLATAALTGFVAVSRLVPSEAQRRERRLHAGDEQDDSNGDAPPNKNPGRAHPLFSIVTAHLFRAAESLLLGVLSTLVAPKPPEPDAPPAPSGSADSTPLQTDPAPTGDHPPA